MNLSSFVTSKYERWDIWLFRKNKPNSNPIKPKTNPIQTQFDERAKMMQNVYVQGIMKKNADMGYEKQSQNKPNFCTIGSAY